jgi:ATP-dependent helicase/nuclease subunit A
MTDAAVAQIRASDPATSVFVTANAGSGKTTTLVGRVARLLLQRVDPAAILCVTYTKAAAAEMQRRLYQQLGDWSVMEDGALSARLAALAGEPTRAFDQEALSRARALFARALETPGGLKIQTIHAFCEKLLRRFPLEAGVSPRFQVLEDVAAQTLSQKARDAVALAAMKEGGGETPLARAFSHFAVDLDRRRFDDLFKTIEARRAELTAYVQACDDGARPTPWALCGAVEGVEPEALEAEAMAGVDWPAWRVATEALGQGSATDLKIAAQMAQVRPETATFEDICGIFCTQKGEARASMATKAVPAATKVWLDEEQSRILDARGPIRAARIARDTVHVLTLAVAYAAVYEAEKAAHRGLDFADLIAKTRELLAAREDAAWVLYKLDGGIDHILLDEAQDTAPEQWLIVRSLTEEFFSGAGVRSSALPDRTIFAVGDEKQSIYSFQGAQPERLLEETDYYLARAQDAEARATTVDLKMSWRSTPLVLSYVDAVFVPEAAAKALDPAYGGSTLRHDPMRVGEAGGVDLWPVFKDVKPPERTAWDDPLDSEWDESARKKLAGRIAAEIKAAVARGDAVQDKDLGAWRAAGFGDFLILVRRRDALFEEIIRALKQAGVPVAGADRLKLSDHIVFHDLLGLARFALFPDDDLALAALLRSPFCDVDETSLYHLAQGRDAALFQALRDRAGERTEWTQALEVFEILLREARLYAPFELFNRLLGRLDRRGRSMRSRILSRLGREAEDAIDEFLNQILAAEGRGVHHLEGLTAALDASEVVVKRELEAARGEVRVMTVHGAKGLEAPVVILPDTTVKAKAQGSPLFTTEDGGFLWAGRKEDDCPASTAARSLRDEKTDQESLRLLYVALTRARDRLVLCGRTPATREADKGSWWSYLSEAFARPEIAEGSREVVAGEMSFTRFGPDPIPGAAGPAAVRAGAALPAWAGVRLPPERGARWASPSNIAEAAKVPAPSPLAERSGLGRFRRGELIHKLFEVLPDLAPDARRTAADRLLAREPGLSEEQRQEMAQAAFGVLEDARFAAVFGPGSRAEAAIAGTAPGLPDGLAISGRLDRLVVGPDRVLVVDYKTNRPAPDRIEDADPAYLDQIAVYVAVLRALYPDRPAEAALVWTDGPRLMAVPQDVIERALERIRVAR